MKKFIFGLTILLIIALSFVISVILNPPLVSYGYTTNAKDETERIVDIVNEGLFNIKLSKVTVNGKRAQQVELGVSRSSHLVIGASLEDDPDISFHNIHDYKIKPKVDQDDISKLMEKGRIIHYGLRISGQENPKRMTIHYNYLGIPLGLQIHFNE